MTSPRSSFQSFASMPSFFGFDLNGGKPGDYYFNVDYHNSKPWIVKEYLKFATVCRTVVASSWFGTLILVTIILSGILVGIDTYVNGDKFETAVVTLDIIALSIFFLECFLKVCMEGLAPRRYFIGPDYAWNIFDFIIIILSVSLSGNSVTFLRLVRLARLGKLIRHIPVLQMILVGFAEGFSSVMPIMLLLVIVLYIFGMIGYYMFATNDPFHFGSLSLSMLHLFRIAVYDNCGDIFFLNTFGCQSYPDLYVTDASAFNQTNSLFWCQNSSPSYIIGPIFFLMYVLIAGFVVLSLFVGAVSLSMASSLRDLEKSEREKLRQKRFKKNLKRLKLIQYNVTKDMSVFDESRSDENSSQSSSTDEMDSLFDGKAGTRNPNPLIRYFYIIYYKINKLFQPDLVLEMIVLKATLGNSLAVAMGWKDQHPSSFSQKSSNDYIISLSSRNDGKKIIFSSKKGSNRNDRISSNIEGNLNREIELSQSSSGTDSDEGRQLLLKSPAVNAVRHSSSVGSVSGTKSAETSTNNKSQTNQDISNDMASIKSNSNNSTLPPPPNQSYIQSVNLGHVLSRQISQRMTQLFAVNKEILGEVKSRPFYIHYYLHLVILCNEIVLHTYFTYFISGVIFAGLIVMGFETDKLFMANPSQAYAMYILDQLILAIFMLEILLKLVSFGFQPWIYFDSWWNISDMVIVIIAYLPQTHSLIYIFRMLKLQRVFKLVNQFSELSVILNALSISLLSIGYIALILFLYFYVFAVLGYVLFERSDPWHFGELHVAMITLLRLLTLDNTFEVLYINFYGCDVYNIPGSKYALFPELCTHPIAYHWIAAAYVITFILFGVQVFLTLFIGVISTSLGTSTVLRRKEIKIELDLKKRAATLRLSSERLEAFHRVFKVLDLDENGLLEEDELRLGLEALSIVLEDDKFDESMNAVDPHRDGLQIVAFVDFMSTLPCYKKSMDQMLFSWFDTRKRNSDDDDEVDNDVDNINSGFLSVIKKRIRRLVNRILGSNKTSLIARQTDAAFIIQECWLNYKKRKLEKLRKREEKLAEERVKREERERLINARFSLDGAGRRNVSRTSEGSRKSTKSFNNNWTSTRTLMRHKSTDSIDNDNDTTNTVTRTNEAKDEEEEMTFNSSTKDGRIDQAPIKRLTALDRYSNRNLTNQVSQAALWTPATTTTVAAETEEAAYNEYNSSFNTTTQDNLTLLNEAFKLNTKTKEKPKSGRFFALPRISEMIPLQQQQTKTKVGTVTAGLVVTRDESKALKQKVPAGYIPFTVTGTSADHDNERSAAATNDVSSLTVGTDTTTTTTTTSAAAVVSLLEGVATQTAALSERLYTHLFAPAQSDLRYDSEVDDIISTGKRLNHNTTHSVKTTATATTTVTTAHHTVANDNITIEPRGDETANNSHNVTTTARSSSSSLAAALIHESSFTRSAASATAPPNLNKVYIDATPATSTPAAAAAAMTTVDVSTHSQSTGAAHTPAVPPPSSFSRPQECNTVSSSKAISSRTAHISSLLSPSQLQEEQQSQSQQSVVAGGDPTAVSNASRGITLKRSGSSLSLNLSSMLKTLSPPSSSTVTTATDALKVTSSSSTAGAVGGGRVVEAASEEGVALLSARYDHDDEH